MVGSGWMFWQVVKWIIKSHVQWANEARSSALVSRDIKGSGHYSLLSTVYEIIYLINQGVCFLTEFKPLILTLHRFALDIKTLLNWFQFVLYAGDKKVEYQTVLLGSMMLKVHSPVIIIKKKVCNSYTITNIRFLKNEIIINEPKGWSIDPVW